MTNVLTFEIVRKGLRDLLMHTVASQIAGECTSTDILKEKLTQIEVVNQTTPEPTRRPATAKMMQNLMRNKCFTCKKLRHMSEHCHIFAKQTCNWCRKRGHTEETCWTKPTETNANGHK
jgi:hypothetical protein